ncbi:MAG: T9SS type A sorting domain-containing protein, partial [Bacteroidota bacterium]
GQTSFSTYVAGLGWVGNLDFLSSPNGYLLRLTETGTLVYPNPRRSSSTPLHPRPRQNTHLAKSAHQWTVNPHDFERTMNVVAIVHDSLAQNVLAPGDAIGAFIGEEVRGVDSVLYIPELRAHLVFLTIYANADGAPLAFRYYDASAGEVHALTDTFTFTGNQVLGAADGPAVLHLPFTTTTTNTTSEAATAGYFHAFPNPVSGGQSVNLAFSAPVGERVEIVITDALGRLVDRLELENPVPETQLEWQPDQLPPGMYTLALRQGLAVRTVRLMIK